MTFADKLKELRIAKGFSQKELADAAHTFQQNIARWETGERMPAFDSVVMLCKALGVRCKVFEECDFAIDEETPKRRKSA